jgi:hypothetical protein
MDIAILTLLVIGVWAYVIWDNKRNPPPDI